MSKRPAKDLRLDWIHDETGLYAILPGGRRIDVAPGADDVDKRHDAEDRERPRPPQRPSAGDPT